MPSRCLLALPCALTRRTQQDHQPSRRQGTTRSSWWAVAPPASPSAISFCAKANSHPTTSPLSTLRNGTTTSLAGPRRRWSPGQDVAAPPLFASLIDPKLRFYNTSLASFSPDSNSVTLGNGDTLTYDQLVVAPGIQVDFGSIKGLQRRWPTPPPRCPPSTATTPVTRPIAMSLSPRALPSSPSRRVSSSTLVLPKVMWLALTAGARLGYTPPPTQGPRLSASPLPPGCRPCLASPSTAPRWRSFDRSVASRGCLATIWLRSTGTRQRLRPRANGLCGDSTSCMPRPRWALMPLSRRARWPTRRGTWMSTMPR